MTPNDIVRIKPTDDGWRVIIKHVDALNDDLRKNHPNITYRAPVPIADAEGYIRGQFWSLMAYFDWSRGIGTDCPFHDMQLIDTPKGPAS